MEKTTFSLSNHRRTLCIVTRERNFGLLVRRCKGTHVYQIIRSRFIQYGSMINGRVLWILEYSGIVFNPKTNLLIKNEGIARW